MSARSVPRPRAGTPNAKQAAVDAAAARAAAAAANAAATAAAIASGLQRRQQTARRERAVMVLLITLGVALGIVGSIQVLGNVRESRARDAMAGTFASVDARQLQFRRLNARFAALGELTAQGFRVPSGQTVRRSSADASHWFMSLHDRETGLICDRTGELSDEEGSARPPICRPGTPVSDATRPQRGSGRSSASRGRA